LHTAKLDIIFLEFSG